MSRSATSMRLPARRSLFCAAAGASLAAIAVVAFFRNSSAQPVRPDGGAPAATGTPATTPTTSPAVPAAGGYKLSQRTSIGRPNDEGSMVWKPVAADSQVELLGAGWDWSRIRTADGREGLVPTALLTPKVEAKGPEDEDPRNAPPVGKWGGTAPPPEVAKAACGGPLPRPTAPPAAASAEWVAALAPAEPGEAAATTEPARPPAPEDGDELPRAVDQAIDRAVEFLYSQQHHGNWEFAPAPYPASPASKWRSGAS